MYMRMDYTLHRYLCVPGEAEVVVPLNPADACNERDAISKVMYQRLFYLIVLQLSPLLDPSGTPTPPTAWSMSLGNSRPHALSFGPSHACSSVDSWYSLPLRACPVLTGSLPPPLTSAKSGYKFDKVSANDGNNVGSSARSIGLLDIFGFESLEHNSLEQVRLSHDLYLPLHPTHSSYWLRILAPA